MGKGRGVGFGLLSGFMPYGGERNLPHVLQLASFRARQFYGLYLSYAYPNYMC